MLAAGASSPRRPLSRAGRASFAQGLRNFGALAGAGDLAFKEKSYGLTAVDVADNLGRVLAKFL